LGMTAKYHWSAGFPAPCRRQRKTSQCLQSDPGRLRAGYGHGTCCDER